MKLEIIVSTLSSTYLVPLLDTTETLDTTLRNARSHSIVKASFQSDIQEANIMIYRVLLEV